MTDDEALRALGAELLRVSRLRAASYPGSQLDNSAFRILWILVERGPLELRELAEELQLERSTVTRQVNAAIGHGLLERYDEAGRAGRLLRPTPAGESAYQHDGLLRAVRLTRALDDLGAERARRLVADLRAFNDALDASLP